MRKLRYVGEGAYVLEVPATDIEVEADDEAARLIETGLYVDDAPAPTKAAPKKGEPTEPAKEG